MSEQAQHWSQAAEGYEEIFIDPYLPQVRNPLRQTIETLLDKVKTAADLGCGIGPLLPFLAERIGRVIAVDFADGMLARARERCQGLANIEFHKAALTELGEFAGQVDLAVAVNSLVLPDTAELDAALRAILATLREGGHFLGIVPAIDAVHYFTMLLLDRARLAGMPADKARQNAAHHAEHEYYDFAFGTFRYKGLEQHFWQPFEVRYRLRRAGFRRISVAKVHLAWEQFGCARDLGDQPPPWDWFFHAQR
ncbi:MAG TPA: class I SAM-dependent methyltransferase [Gemmataceae bacterium]|nr:class I SAM-dependent methyltransferase [Gemmataceae bacterium]